MATREQCEAAARKRLKTMVDVIAFTDEWGGGHVPARDAGDDPVEMNINRILNDAVRNDLLDQLGTALGLATDAEQQRVANETAAEAARDSAESAKEANKIAKAAHKWSWFALALASASLLWQVQDGCGLIGG